MENSEKIKYLMYLRKSTDSEDRQIQSIEDQRKELEKYAKLLNLEVVGFYEENKSAKAPGRIEFNKMLEEIKRGGANGILCWKINRLSRNPIDGGEIQWLLQESSLRSIQTPSREYRTGDNVMMMSVELGMANQFVLDLSKDVKRGLVSKAEKGWRPGLAPIGYLNDRYQDKGSKEILVDEKKFNLVRKMWELMLTGNYTVPQIAEIVNDQWGLRTSYYKRQTRLSLSHIYRIFTNTFYYGEFEYAGKVYQGQHKIMITPEEYDQVQKILGRKGKPRAKHKKLPLTGLIFCGECGCAITADEKTKYVKSEGKIHSYIYHRCTKRKAGITCNQKPINYSELESQAFQIIDSISIPESYFNLAIEILNRENEKESVNRELLIKNQQKAFIDCTKRIDNLIKLYISSDNANRELLSDEEFREQKSVLLKEKSGIQRELKNLDERINEWIDLTEKTFKFATYSKYWFSEGTYEDKSAILRALGSNFVLKDQKLSIQLQKQYELIQNGVNLIKVEFGALEPAEFASEKAKTAHLEAVSTMLSG